MGEPEVIKFRSFGRQAQALLDGSRQLRRRMLKAALACVVGGLAILLALWAFGPSRRARVETPPAAVDEHAQVSTPAPSAPPLASSSPPPTVPSTTVVHAGRAASSGPRSRLDMPRGFSTEKSYEPSSWKLPRSIAAALELHPELKDKLATRNPESVSMADFKLGWLPRFQSCLASDGVTFEGQLDVDFRFELDDQAEQWIGRRADVLSPLDEAQEQKVLDCVAKTFVGLERPFGSADHDDHYTFKTRITIPAEGDYIYRFIDGRE